MTAMTRSTADVVSHALTSLVAGDPAAAEGLAPDVRWLDEHTGRWQTGAAGMIETYREQMTATGDAWVDLGDLTAVELGDTAIVSSTLTFGGTYDGEPFALPCPATFVLRRSSDEWRIVHFHTLAFRGEEGEAAENGEAGEVGEEG
ncbi:MAG TPA: nuclear transport factor 2 family protein [Candidatus Limnocylindrales bacterium]|nr:nuclear transport factor 2 family protein [Candidatus Limnocylindrales bacterium]